MTDKILTVMEKNARIRIDDLANILGEESARVRQEVERLETDKVICGYHTLINWDKVGQEKADAIIEVKVAPQRGVGFDQVAERIWQYPEVSSMFLVSGNCDFIVLLQGKSMREIAMFVSEKLATIDGVLSTMTQFILKKYKQEGFVVENPHKDEREAIS